MENKYFYNKNPEIKGLLQAKAKDKKPEIIFRDDVLHAVFDSILGGDIIFHLLFTNSNNKYIFYKEDNVFLEDIFIKKSGCIYTVSLYQKQNKSEKINGGYKSMPAYTVTSCEKCENLYMYIMNVFSKDYVYVSDEIPDKNHILDRCSKSVKKSKQQILDFLKDSYPIIYQNFYGQ